MGLLQVTPENWDTADEIEVKEEEISDGMENEMIFAGKLRTSLTDTFRPKSRKTEEKSKNKNQTSKTEFISKDQTVFSKMKEKGLREITKDEKQGRGIATKKTGTQRKISGVNGGVPKRKLKITVNKESGHRVYTNCKKSANKVLYFSSSRLSNENHSNQRPCTSKGTSKGTSILDKTPEKENSQRNMPITEHHSFVKQISSIEKVVPVSVQTQTGITSLSSGHSSTNQGNSSANSETSALFCDPISLDDPSILLLRLLPSGSPNNPKVSGKFVSERQTPSEYVGQPEINKLDSASSINSTCDKATQQDELFRVKQVDKMPVMKSKDGNFLIPNHGGLTSMLPIAPSCSDFVLLEPVCTEAMPVNISTQEKSTLRRDSEIDVDFSPCRTLSTDNASSVDVSLKDDILIPYNPKCFEEICEDLNNKSFSSQGNEQVFLGSFEFVHPFTLVNKMKVNKCSEIFTGPWRFF